MKIENVVACLYGEYGRYIETFRAIPSNIDCLKYVERRLLVSTFEVAKDNLQKSAKIVGHCIGKYHPHGDASCYESLVNLVERGLVIGHGNWGKRGLQDSKPAAMRYTECKSNNAIYSKFESLLSFVPHLKLELDPEPLFIPSPIPIGLIGNNYISGIGFNITKIPRFTEKNLYKRLGILKSKFNEDKISPNFENCNILVKDDIFTNNRFMITVIPKVMKSPKLSHITIIGKIANFSKLMTDSYNDKEDKVNYEVFDVWNYKSSYNIEIEVKPYRRKIDDDFIKQIISKLVNKITFVINTVNFEKNIVENDTIDGIILRNFNKYIETYHLKLDNDINKLNEKLLNLSILQKIKEVLINEPQILLKPPSDIILDLKNKNIDCEEIIKKNSIYNLINTKLNSESTKTELQKLLDLKSNLIEGILCQLPGI